MPSYRIVVPALILALLGVLLSGVLLFEHHGERAAVAIVKPLCGAEVDSGCDKVKRSSFSEVRGIPVAALGLFYFGSLAALLALMLPAGPEARRAAATLAGLLTLFGLACDVVLLAIQAFVVKAFCNLCLLSYLPTVAVLVLLWTSLRGLKAVASAWRQAEVRSMLAAWVVATLAVGVAVGATDQALAARQAARPVEGWGPAPDSLSLEAARAEVKRLRELLDDPNKVEQHFAQRAIEKFQKETPRTVNYTGAPTLGRPGLPIRAMVYSDFLCPWCRQLAQWLPQFAAQPMVVDRLAISFKNYPLDTTCNKELPRTVHEGACHLALGAVCAHEQGRFWDYHDRAFAAGLEKATAADVTRIAGQAGLDVARFQRCLATPEAQQRLQSDIAEARAVGVHATPTILLNGKPLAQPDHLPLMLQVESARLGLPIPTPPPQAQ